MCAVAQEVSQHLDIAFESMEPGPQNSLSRGDLDRPDLEPLKQESISMNSTVNLERKNAFLAKYRVQIVDNQVSFTLSPGTSRFDLLSEAENLSPSVRGDSPMSTPLDRAFGSNPYYTTKVTEDFKGSAIIGSQPRRTQEAMIEWVRNWSEDQIANYYLADVAYFVATGKHLDAA